jgi:hypothetical protein
MKFTVNVYIENDEESLVPLVTVVSSESKEITNAIAHFLSLAEIDEPNMIINLPEYDINKIEVMVERE